jgi:eukaryotic-like serine/threonine-protein kinase
VSFFKRFTTRKAIKIYIILTLFLVFCTVCDRVLLPWYVNLGGVVKVPNVIGMQEQKAFKVLLDADITPIEAGKRFDSKYPEGVVIFQSPLPNMKVRENRRIYLTISGGEEYAEVPDLTGRSQRDAKIVLFSNNLQLGRVSYDSTKILSAEVVVDQSPSKYKKMKPGSYVSITLSMTNQEGQIAVPNLINKSLTEAGIILPQHKLVLGKINYIIKSELIPNTVIDQYPRVGAKVEENKPIDVWVSKESSSPMNFPEN